MKKYMTNIGQKTGTLKMSKNVQNEAITIDLVAEYLKTNKNRTWLWKFINFSYSEKQTKSGSTLNIFEGGASG